MKLFLSIALLSFHIMSYTQSKPFVPLDYEYPETHLSTPKTYVYKNATTSELNFKDFKMVKKEGEVIVTWKGYDSTPLSDSSIEVNDKAIEHYLILNGQKMKAVITEDSLYNDGSRLGEKRQSEYFNLNPTTTLTDTIRSSFLRDTTITWNNKNVPCLIIQSELKYVLTNSQDVSQQKEGTAKTLYYFGKDVGLIRYLSEKDGNYSVWELQEIKETE